MTRLRMVLVCTFVGATLVAFSAWAQSKQGAAAEKSAKAKGGSAASKNLEEELRLLRFKEAQDDVQLTDEQKEKLQGADTVKKVVEALTPEQLERLKQIRLQAIGPLALVDPSMASALNLTGQQRQMFRAIPKQIQQQMRNMSHGKMASGEKDAKLAQVRASLLESALQMLTPEQREKFQKMLGPKINLDFLKSSQKGAAPASRPKKAASE